MTLLLITFLLVSTAFSVVSTHPEMAQSINDHIALRVAEEILHVFNGNAFGIPRYLDFDPNFVYDNCGHKLSTEDFIKASVDLRATFWPTGLVKYTLLDIHPIPRNFDGVDFTLHVDFNEMGVPHIDMRFTLKRIRDLGPNPQMEAGPSWKLLNCSRLCGDHLKIPSTAMRTFTLYYGSTLGH